MSKRNGQKTLDFFCRSQTSKGRDADLAGSPVDQVRSGATLAEPWVDEAASMDAAWMLASRPLQWQSSLLRAALGNIEPADLIKISLYSGWLYLTNYGKFYFVYFILHENINNIKY